MRLSLSPRSAVTAVTLLVLAAGSLRAQSNTIDTTFAVRSGTRLDVQGMSGSVTVRQWNRNQIRVVAEYDRGRVDFQFSPSQLTVRSENRRGQADVEYTISVPTGTPVEVSNALNMDVSVTGVCGPVNITTVSGDIDVQCADGEATIGSVSGDIMVADVRGPLEINATSGDVDLRGARGPVSVHVVSGDVSLADIAHNEVDVETVNGEVEYTGRILENGRYRFSSHNGDVTLNVTGNLTAIFTVSTFSGDFESDFPITLNPGTRVSKEWEFQVPSSGNLTNAARVRLNSFSGAISLRRGAGGTNRE